MSKEMADRETRSERPWALILAGAVSIVLLVWAIWATVSARGIETRAEESIRRVRDEAALQVREARQEALDGTARAVGVTLVPLMVFKDQVPEISDRQVQQVVEGLLEREGYRFVAVSDASGRVIASSDLALVGRPVQAASPPLAGVMRAQAPIGDPSLGSVVLYLPAMGERPPVGSADGSE
jgi:hypothetical protein